MVKDREEFRTSEVRVDGVGCDGVDGAVTGYPISEILDEEVRW